MGAAMELAKRVAERYAQCPLVQAVALAGSQSGKVSDQGSDIDLYIYVNTDVPLQERARIARESSSRAEVGNSFFEPGDEWIDRESGIAVDVMFRHQQWIREQLERVLVCHEASMGYSTCFWYNVRNSVVLFDRSRWFEELHAWAQQPYPPELQRAIIAKNLAFLRDAQSSYLHQIETACRRNDRVALNHRLAAFLASYFDVLFALNLQPHPGEKRLIEFAERLCKKRPEHFREDITAILELQCRPGEALTGKCNDLVQQLADLLDRHGFPARRT
jgi:hypothetical protein